MPKVWTDEPDIEQLKTYKEEFHLFWKEQGEPHPNSNKYLTLTRVFWYTKGFESGVRISMEMEKENENA